MNLRYLSQTPYHFIVSPAPLDPKPKFSPSDPKDYKEYVCRQHTVERHQFMPLVTKELCLSCCVDILFLRPEPPGRILAGGDIDNRLKTLFDAFKCPSQLSDFGPEYQPPTSFEMPMYVLLEDDSLISKVSVETDTMLEPLVGGPEQSGDSRLIMTVTIKPSMATIHNMPLV